MNFETLMGILAVAASLLLVVTSLLNFSVFLRQLRAGREQVETARRMLEAARQGPEIQLVQRAMMETSDHLRILVEKPYLRPYFYDNKEWREGDQATLDEVKAMAELLLDNLASAIIHSAAFPQYPIRGVEQNIRFHLRQTPVPPRRPPIYAGSSNPPGMTMLSAHGANVFSIICKRRRTRSPWRWPSTASTGCAIFPWRLARQLPEN
jgi:hypothetical protein